jgi:hypothetical protein
MVFLAIPPNTCVLLKDSTVSHLCEQKNTFSTQVLSNLRDLQGPEPKAKMEGPSRSTKLLGGEKILATAQCNRRLWALFFLSLR